MAMLDADTERRPRAELSSLVDHCGDVHALQALGQALRSDGVGKGAKPLPAAAC